MQMQNQNQNCKRDLRQRCYQFSLEIFKLTDTLPQKRSGWVIADQLIRSATSIGANLIEARASSSRLEYKKFYEILLKSANETIYWLGLLRDAKLADEKIASCLLQEANELARMLASGVIKLKSKKF